MRDHGLAVLGESRHPPTSILQLWGKSGSEKRGRTNIWDIGSGDAPPPPAVGGPAAS